MAGAGDADRKRKQPSRDTSKRKDKGPAGPSEPQAEGVNDAWPWPRPDKKPIEDVPEVPHMTAAQLQKTPSYRQRKQGDGWAEFNSICYNGLLRVTMAPTRFICASTLQKMGISDDVASMLKKLHMDRFAGTTYPLYPELVRQFLASVEVYYRDPDNPVASQGWLTFLYRGVPYELSIKRLCHIYGFETQTQKCVFTPFEDCRPLTRLWRTIGQGDGSSSRDNKISLIRNPAIRVVAKFLGHTFFAKEETGSLRFDELLMLHYMLPEAARDIYGDHLALHFCHTNLGAVFASTLAQKKFRGLNTKDNRQKTETVGSLLTPIFQDLGIDLTSTERTSTFDLMDETYLKNSLILYPQNQYRFTHLDGSIRYCQLPCPALTSLTSVENLQFLPDDDHLSSMPSMPATSSQRGRTSRGYTARHNQEDTEVPPSSGTEPDSREYVIPPYTGEFDLDPRPSTIPADENTRWIMDGIEKNHSMMRRLWDALARLQCPRPPSCFRGSRTSTRETDFAGPSTAAAAYPDVAAHGTRSSDEDTDDGPTLRPRRRKAAGASMSASSERDDHST